jgi:2-hydroxy-6-oxonona-2,4-dienedioate hydrolase
MKVRVEKIAGVETRYYHEGSGFPVILVHGVGVAADTWLKNIDPLARHFSVFAPDLLGSGFTGLNQVPQGPPQPYLVEHLANFVDHIGVREFALVGSSLGALISALLYFRMPERVTRLALVSCSTLLGEFDDNLRQAILQSRENGRKAFAAPTPEITRQRMANICFDPASIPESLVLMQMTSNALPGARESYEARMQGLLDFASAREYSIGARIQQIDVPMLILWGMQDPRGSYELALAQFGQVARARLIPFQNCGHLPHLEHPEQFNEHLIRFIGATP